MKNRICLIAFAILVSAIPGSLFAQSSREMTVQEGDTSFVMKQYFFCMLKRGPNRSQDSATAAKIQSGHLDYLNKMSKDGVLLMAGPFGDDTEWRGILIFDVETKEEVEKLVSQDPAVKAGRLIADIHPWWTVKGKLEK